MLYTTKQIAEMYSGEQQNVTPYMITHTWIPGGLKKIKGKGHSFLFKQEWVEEYLENQANVSIPVKQNIRPIRKKEHYKTGNLRCFVK